MGRNQEKRNRDTARGKTPIFDALPPALRKPVNDSALVLAADSEIVIRRAVALFGAGIALDFGTDPGAEKRAAERQGEIAATALCERIAQIKEAAGKATSDDWLRCKGITVRLLPNGQGAVLHFAYAGPQQIEGIDHGAD